MLQRVAACCSVLQRVAACCSEWRCVSIEKTKSDEKMMLLAVCRSVLQCVTV